MTTDNFAPELAIKVSDGSYTIATERVLGSSPFETGGILVGWWEDGQTPVVHDLLPVSDPSAGGHHYERVQSRAQETLELHRLAHTDDRCGYIGEWHSHPAPQPPSVIDRRTLADIVRERCAPVALIVLSIDNAENIVPYGLIGKPRRFRRVAIDVVNVRRSTQ